MTLLKDLSVVKKYNLLKKKNTTYSHRVKPNVIPIYEKGWYYSALQ